jgi:hypothetical protein
MSPSTSSHLRLAHPLRVVPAPQKPRVAEEHVLGVPLDLPSRVYGPDLME